MSKGRDVAICQRLRPLLPFSADEAVEIEVKGVN